MGDRLKSLRNPDSAGEGRTALIRLLRWVLFAVIILVTSFYVLNFEQNAQPLGTKEVGLITGWPWVLLFSLTLAGGVIAIDLLTPEKKIETVSGLFFGIVAGVAASIAFSYLIDRIAEAYEIEGQRIIGTIKILLGIAATYMSISIVLQTQDQFRLVIPYVEFSKQFRGTKPMLLDTSVLIDGRLLELARTGVIQTSLVIPQFVVDELQRLADSSDSLKRSRGRRGLELVARLQREPRLDVLLDQTPLSGGNVDQMLLDLARRMPGMILTTDSGLAQVAGIHGVPVVNLHDLEQALRPSLIPGDSVEVRLVRRGDQPSQGVGYLDDGTMVIAEDGAQHIGRSVQLTIVSSLQTSAGRLLFGRLSLGLPNGARKEAAVLPKDPHVPSESPVSFLPPPREECRGEEANPPSDDQAPSGEPVQPGDRQGDLLPPTRRRDSRRSSARNPRR